MFIFTPSLLSLLAKALVQQHTGSAGTYRRHQLEFEPLSKDDRALRVRMKVCYDLPTRPGAYLYFDLSDVSRLGEDASLMLPLISPAPAFTAV